MFASRRVLSFPVRTFKWSWGSYCYANIFKRNRLQTIEPKWPGASRSFIGIETQKILMTLVSRVYFDVVESACTMPAMSSAQDFFDTLECPRILVEGRREIFHVRSQRNLSGTASKSWNLSVLVCNSGQDNPRRVRGKFQVGSRVLITLKRTPGKVDPRRQRPVVRLPQIATMMTFRVLRVGVIPFVIRKNQAAPENRPLAGH